MRLEVNLSGTSLWILTVISGDIDKAVNCENYAFESEAQATKRRDEMIAYCADYYGIKAIERNTNSYSSTIKVTYAGVRERPDFSIQYVIKQIAIQ